MKPDGVSAEVVLSALDGLISFIVCPALLDECRRVLQRDRFRRYLSVEQADVLVDSIEAASEVVPDPTTVVPASSDPDDDYLIALAVREAPTGMISGDSDLTIRNGPTVLTPRQVLNLFVLTPSQRLVLVTALWNLNLRVKAIPERSPRLTTYQAALRSATIKLGGDATMSLFNAPHLDETTSDVRQLNREERSIAAFAIEFDRRTTGMIHAEHADDTDDLLAAFHLTDIYADIEGLIEPT